MYYPEESSFVIVQICPLLATNWVVGLMMVVFYFSEIREIREFSELNI